MYAAYLSRFLLPQSVCQYLNVVGLLHRDMGLPNPLLDNWTLSAVLKGIKRVLGVPPVPRLPITPDILLRIRSRLNLNCSRHASFWAICLVSFFGMFRKSHLLPISPAQFDPVRQFTRADFVRTTFGMVVSVRWSKTIQLGQRTIAIPLISNPTSLVCPVNAVSQAFTLTVGAESSSQAFCWQDASNSQTTIFT